MDTLLFLLSMFQPLPKISVGMAVPPPPQAAPPVPFNWKPVIVVGAIAVVAYAVYATRPKKSRR